MTKREKRIAGFMVFLIIICVFIYLSPDKKENKAIRKKPEASLQRPVAVAKKSTQPDQLDLKNMAEQIQLSSKDVDRNSVRDPFKKGQLREVAKSASFDFADLVLAGIILEEDKDPVALINEQILKEGDEFSGFKIEVIRENEVFMTKGLEKYTLKLFRELQENQGE